MFNTLKFCKKMGNLYTNILQVGIGCLILIGLGYYSSKFKLLTAEEFKTANQFSGKVCFPFLLFRSLASKKIREITFQPLVNALLMSSSSQILICVLFLFPFEDRLYTYLSTVVSSCYINYIILGVPIFSSIWGDNYNHIPAICSFCHYILLVPLFMIWAQLYGIRKHKRELYEAAKRREEEAAQNDPSSVPSMSAQEGQSEPEHVDEKMLRITWKDVVWAFASALKTPLVIGNFCGLIWSAIGIPYPTYFQRLGKYLGDGVVVYALFSIGRFLQQHSLFACKIWQLLTCLFIRFFICPGFSCLYAYALKLDHTLARQCVILSGLPAANAGFILASSVGIGADVASAMVFWSLVLIVPVVMMWFAIFDHGGLFP